jgi:hypothetical protein
MKTISLIIIGLVGLLIVSGLRTAPTKSEPRIVIVNHNWSDKFDSSYVDRLGTRIYCMKKITYIKELKKWGLY